VDSLHFGGRIWCVRSLGVDREFQHPGRWAAGARPATTRKHRSCGARYPCGPYGSGTLVVRAGRITGDGRSHRFLYAALGNGLVAQSPTFGWGVAAQSSLPSRAGWIGVVLLVQRLAAFTDRSGTAASSIDPTGIVEDSSRQSGIGEFGTHQIRPG